jgi:hypothetical protein
VYCTCPNIGEKSVSNSSSEKCVVTLKLHTKLNIFYTCISLTIADCEREFSCMQLSYIWINTIILFTTVRFNTQDGTYSIYIISYAEMVSNKAIL